MSLPESDEFSQDNNSNKELAAQKEQILKQILMPDARMRLNNIKMVKPELSDLVEQYLIGMATQGKIRGQLTDDQLKQILLSIQQPKRDFKINRI
ncbi:DNA-binding protein [Nitrosopumilus sp.]|uniref:DNA-binding protein n=1 Tax=Nitrosopumilus sp. TaxID=2024843 RepID=UPI003B5CDCA3